MDKTTNQLINQLHLDGKKENAVRKLVENAGGVNSQTPLVNEVIGDELIPINQNGENKAVTVEQIKNNILSVPSSYEFVDLGLPSGIKWATCNIGASKPEEFGLYFAWGETEGYTVANVEAGRKTFSYDDYKFTNDGGNTFTKYSEEDKKTILDLEDDGAYQYDNTCRIPTREEYQELIDNTTQTKEVLNSIDGLRFTSKINNNSIFIPNGGFIEDNSFSKIDNKYFLWTSTRRSNVGGRAYCFYADSNYIETSLIFSYEGFSIRPVQFKASSTINLNNLSKQINDIDNAIGNIESKTNKMVIDGKGTKFLSDDGTYKESNASSQSLNINLNKAVITKEDYDKIINAIDNHIQINVLIYNENGDEVIGMTQANVVLNKTNNSIYCYYTIFDAVNNVNKNYKSIINGSNYSVNTSFEINTSTSPYIWDGKSSNAIYNELTNCYKTGRTIIYMPDSYTYYVVTKIDKQNTNDDLIIYIADKAFLVNNFRVTEYISGSKYYSTEQDYLYPNTFNICSKTINKNTTFYLIADTLMCNIFEGMFTFGDNIYSVEIVDDYGHEITWSTDSVLEYKPNHTYYFKIVLTNNKRIGVMKEFAN